MLLDGFTILAQVVNFLILVLLLRRFLYRPVLRMMDEREARIAAQLEEARQKRAEAEAEAEKYRQWNREMAERREAFLFEAKEEAEAWRKKLMDRAHQEIDEARARWDESVRQERAAFVQELRERVGEQVVVVSRQALTDLAGVELEQQMIHAFIEQIRAMGQDQQERLAQSLQEAGSKVDLYTSFEVRPEVRRTLEAEVRAAGGDGMTVEFLRAPGLICGIEARIASHKIAWTLDGYLETLSERLFEALAESSEEQRTGELAAQA